MSGSSRVSSQGACFHLAAESPCMNFAMDRNHPNQEQDWHQRWTARTTPWLARLHAVLETRLVAGDGELIVYDEKLPLWSEYQHGVKPPCRIQFLAIGGGGSVMLSAAFRSLPDEAARKDFENEFRKDVRLIDEEGKG